jgi:hypothetical protein
MFHLVVFTRDLEKEKQSTIFYQSISNIAYNYKKTNKR